LIVIGVQSVPEQIFALGFVTSGGGCTSGGAGLGGVGGGLPAHSDPADVDEQAGGVTQPTESPLRDPQTWGGAGGGGNSGVKQSFPTAVCVHSVDVGGSGGGAGLIGSQFAPVGYCVPEQI
jgi:hypothetical protein